MKIWLRQNWYHLLFVPVLLALLIWLGYLVRSNDPNRANWLLLPITAIYAVISAYIAVAGFRNAQAAIRAAEAMEKSVAEMQFSRFLQHAPEIRFRDECEYFTIPDNDAVQISLCNMSSAPVLSLRAFLWELEATPDGKAIKYSSMRNSRFCDYDKGAFDLKLTPTEDSEDAKITVGKEAIEGYKKRNMGSTPSQEALCVLVFDVRGAQSPLFLFYDLKCSGPLLQETAVRLKSINDKSSD